MNSFWCQLPQVHGSSVGNSGLCWTVFARNRDTAVPAEGHGDLQTLICVLVARPRRCSTLSNPVPWKNWMAAYLGYTLRTKTLFCCWPIMVHNTHTRRSAWSTWRGRETTNSGVGGQRSRSHEVEDRFGGMTKAFSTPLGRYVLRHFLIYLVERNCLLCAL